jgi:hypothetical protein
MVEESTSCEAQRRAPIWRVFVDPPFRYTGLSHASSPQRGTVQSLIRTARAPGYDHELVTGLKFLELVSASSEQQAKWVRSSQGSWGDAPSFRKSRGLEPILC